MLFESSLACNCNTEGSEDLTCDAITGKCHCKCNIEGDKCDTCTNGHKSFPDCHGKFKLFKSDYFLFHYNTILFHERM